MINKHQDKIFTVIPSEGHLYKLASPIFARAYFFNYSIDLLANTKEKETFKDWYESLDEKLISLKDSKRLIHFFYESGFFIEGISDVLNKDDLLSIDVQYATSEKIELGKESKCISLSEIYKISYEDYLKKFELGYKELTKGNCYQFNLTSYSKHGFEKTLAPWDFINKLWEKKSNRAAYASATYIDSLDKLFLSNSPECLFDYENGTIVTRPIKGTIKRDSDEKEEIKKLWKELVADKKSEAELFMIADLLRNDLCRIDRPNAIIEKRKVMLLVPNLIHQYSELSAKLASHVTLKNVLDKMFPGGSVTGAPKKRVIKILKQIENYNRGFYCGSTLLINKSSIKSSINIRSATICFREHTLTYASGGGITLKSEPFSEYLEMSYKEKSFIELLTL